MTHRIIIIQSQTPAPAGLAVEAIPEPEFSVRVEFHPSDSMTASQIGNEVARIQRRVNQIIEGTPD